MIKTFRGLLTDDTQDTIVLHTNDGSTGYRIVKLQIFSYAPGVKQSENVVKVYKVSQTAIDGVVDFSDNTLLAAAYLETSDSPTTTDNPQNTIFDNEVFNQDIYVTQSDVNGGDPCNYYLELEQVNLDLSESTVATLKDIRNVKTQGF